MNQEIKSRGQTLTREGAGSVRLRRIGEAVADLFFPPRCTVCQRLGAWLCNSCMAEIEVIRPPVCLQCGLPIEAPGTEHRCSTAPALDGLRACAFHTEPLRQAIHDFKYRDLTALALRLGRLMSDTWAELDSDWSLQVVVPVPLHPQRQRQRGYNQSALLAKELAANLKLPLLDGVLRRVRATVPQVDLDVEQRRINVRDAFDCQPHALAGKSALLVDDVCTTGATLGAASQALKAAGASFVLAYTLARAKPPGYRQFTLESQSL